MSTAWGKTGRVTLVEPGEYGYSQVIVGGRKVGEVWPLVGKGTWFGSLGSSDDPPHPFGWSADLPAFDHAVMWVLRRAAPKVWREERGPVARVALTAGGWMVTCPNVTHKPYWWEGRDLAFRHAANLTSLCGSKL